MTGTQQRKTEGFWNVTPRIEVISFPTANQLQINLEDGRIILVPLDRFPSIQELTMEQRVHWYRFGNGFSFDASDKVIHIEQILGNFDIYRHESQL